MMPSSLKNRFDGLMFYSLIPSLNSYSMHTMMRMQEIKTQQTATRNRAQSNLIHFLLLIDAFLQ